MPKGEEMFKFHWCSGACPKPLLPRDKAPAPQPDCRTCIYYRFGSGAFCAHPRECVNASEYKPAQPLQLWRKE